MAFGDEVLSVGREVVASGKQIATLRALDLRSHGCDAIWFGPFYDVNASTSAKCKSRRNRSRQCQCAVPKYVYLSPQVSWLFFKAAHFDRNETCTYFGDSTLKRR